MSQTMGQTMGEPRQNLDPRIARTRTAVELAVIKLLSEERPFTTLTISEVAKAAGITRKTLYARFGSLEQVVKGMASGMFEEIADNITNDMLKVPLSDSVLTSVAFRAHEQHKSTLMPLLKYCPSFLFLDPCREVTGELIDRIISVNHFHPLPAFEREYLTAIHCSTLHATLTVWVERGFIDSPDQLSELIVKLFGPGVDSFLKSLV
ncbi:MAG TPA: TetR/AcrR family transcriptional regulator [Gammaproteobacteria bacterium]|jgi:AcrR family transcriptional regulator|nr:TetR/AcrR family transcriptional regulator [Gammaproteobacteria bacterium]